MAAFAIRDWHVNIHCRRFIVCPPSSLHTHIEKTHNTAKQNQEIITITIDFPLAAMTVPLNNNTTKYYLQW